MNKSFLVIIFLFLILGLFSIDFKEKVPLISENEPGGLARRPDPADIVAKDVLSDQDSAELVKKEISSDKFTAGDPIRAKSLLEVFYRRRNYQPAWSGFPGASNRIEELIGSINKVHLEGLTSQYYHLETVTSVREKIARDIHEGRMSDPRKLAALDVLLTDAFLTLGCDYSAGCSTPVMLRSGWNTRQDNRDVVAVLERALRENSIEKELANLLPSQSKYSRLKRALLFYREIKAKGGWQPITPGPLLEIDERSERVADLRERLVASGDIYRDEGKDDLFDEELARAVRKFQKRHGLKTDGIVGPATLEKLNVPVEERIRQIRVNLERLRWLLAGIGERYIMVNIANFELDVVDNDRRVMSMKVVVGKPFWHTPIFSAKMTYLVLNPYWNVPGSIAAKDVLPKIKKDPDYLETENMKVIRGWGEREEIIDPGSVDWLNLQEKTFNFRLRQEPCPQNPLGRIKFMFPNKYNVYLHDSSAHHLFDREVRSFSHGCIRIEQPVELAAYLLRGNPEWTEDRIIEEIETGTEQEVRIPDPINVHVVYLTSWVDDDGFVQFRDDIYGRDAELFASLDSHPYQK